jgi:hypothetical protein
MPGDLRKILSDSPSFKLKAQAGPDALLNSLKGWTVEDPDVVKPLSRIPP